MASPTRGMLIAHGGRDYTPSTNSDDKIDFIHDSTTVETHQILVILTVCQRVIVAGASNTQCSWSIC